MKIRLSEYVSTYFVNHGIEECFMVVGGGAMYLNDAFGHQKGMHCTFNHHEQASAMAAEAYARLTNKPALVSVTTGPGGINALNGVLGAYLDSLPMIIVSGQVKSTTTVRYHNQLHPDKPLRSFGDQEYDITKITKEMCKYACLLEHPNDIAYVLEKALYLANHGRKGPVWIDIPLDFQAAIIDTKQLKTYNPKEDSSHLPKPIDEKTVNTILEKIKKAKRPVIYTGNGIRLANAADVFKKVLRNLRVPVVTSWDCIDLIETENPLYVGRAGNMGDRAGNFAVQNADVLLVIGNRLSIRNVGYNYETWAREAYVIMVDIDRSEMVKHTLHINKKVWADAYDFLSCIDKIVSKEPIHAPKEWLQQGYTWKTKYPVVLNKHHKQKQANTYVAFDYLSKHLKNNSITVTSNGSCCVMGHQSWYIKKKTRFLNNNAVASMGYGLPAAIGACIANNKKEVYCLEGDGSIMMNLQELQTIVTNKLPIKIILINNEGYHSIRQSQNAFFHGRSKIGIGPESADLSFPNFKKIAAAFSIPYCSIKTNAAMVKTLDTFIQHDSYMICEIFVSTKQNFEPKSSTKVLPDGTLYSPALEDLAPFLDSEELQENMYIPLVQEK